jgi:hypothetical protein
VEHSKGSPKRKVYSHEHICQKDEKISNQWPNTTAETPKKTRTNKSQKEIIKIRAEINEIETNKKHTKNQWNKKMVHWKNK